MKDYDSFEAYCREKLGKEAPQYLVECNATLLYQLSLKVQSWNQSDVELREPDELYWDEELTFLRYGNITLRCDLDKNSCIELEKVAGYAEFETMYEELKGDITKDKDLVNYVVDVFVGIKFPEVSLMQ